VTDRRPSLSWVGLLRVNDEGAANKLIFRIRERLNLEMQLGEVEKYWKDETLYRCTFDTRFQDDVRVDLADEVLEIAQRLAPMWHVSGLARKGNLEGVAADGIAVSGVTWLSFALTR
jgi:hypothetical protein